MAPSKTGLRKQLADWTDMTPAEETPDDDPSGAGDASGGDGSSVRVGRGTGYSGNSARGTRSFRRGKGRDGPCKGIGSSKAAMARSKTGIGSSNPL